MDGVKTALVGFIFVCIIFPGIIKNRHQYYLALATVILSMLFQLLGLLVASRVDFVRYCQVLEILLEIASVLILVMAAGGLSARQLAGDMARAYEVMRRGEETSEVLIPVAAQPRRSSKPDGDAPPERIAIDDDDNDPLYDPKRFGAQAAPPPQPPGALPLDEPPAKL